METGRVRGASACLKGRAGREQIFGVQVAAGELVL
jgi:hypothetical protein